MWYFAWMLGVGFAVLLAILNAMWGETAPDRLQSGHAPQGLPPDPADRPPQGSKP